MENCGKWKTAAWQRHRENFGGCIYLQWELKCEQKKTFTEIKRKLK